MEANHVPSYYRLIELYWSLEKRVLTFQYRTGSKLLRLHILASPTMKQVRLLVANRGEIASRVLASARELDMYTIAIFSAEDRFAGYRQKADESYLVGGPGIGPLEAYLDGARIVEIAKQHQVDLVHPGYGFLAENAGFASQVRQAGMACSLP